MTKSKNQKPKAQAAKLAFSPPGKVADITQFINNPKQMENIMNQSKNQFEKFTAESSNIGRQSMEAANKSAALFAKGMEEIMRTAMSMAQESFEKQSELAKAAMTIKTINEMAEVQNKIAQSLLDDTMSAFTKLSEMTIKVMTAAAEPMNEQMTKGMKKAQSMAA